MTCRKRRVTVLLDHLILLRSSLGLYFPWHPIAAKAQRHGSVI